MRGRVGAGLLTAALVALPAHAFAEETSPEAATGIESLVSVQEIGLQGGIAAGGRVTPGGVHLSAWHLYQLSDTDWFDGGIGFVFGSNTASCFRDRQNQVLCDHGLASGFAGKLSIGVRRWLRSQGRFIPYVRGGFAAGVATFSKDEVVGLSLPLWIGAGVRARVSDGVALTGGATVEGGVGWYSRGLGMEPIAALVIFAGADFGL